MFILPDSSKSAFDSSPIQENPVLFGGLSDLQEGEAYAKLFNAVLLGELGEGEDSPTAVFLEEAVIGKDAVLEDVEPLPEVLARPVIHDHYPIPVPDAADAPCDTNGPVVGTVLQDLSVAEIKSVIGDEPLPYGRPLCVGDRVLSQSSESPLPPGEAVTAEQEHQELNEGESLLREPIAVPMTQKKPMEAFLNRKSLPSAELSSNLILGHDVLELGQEQAQHRIGSPVPSEVIRDVPIAWESFEKPVDIFQPEVHSVFAEKALFLIKGDLKKAEIKCHPADLGPIQIQVSLQKDEAKLGFVTHDQQVLQILENGLPKLREWLEDRGINLSEANVHLSSGDNLSQFGQKEADTQPVPRAVKAHEDKMPEVVELKQVVVLTRKVDCYV